MPVLLHNVRERAMAPVFFAPLYDFWYAKNTLNTCRHSISFAVFIEPDPFHRDSYVYLCNKFRWLIRYTHQYQKLCISDYFLFNRFFFFLIYKSLFFRFVLTHVLSNYVNFCKLTFKVNVIIVEINAYLFSRFKKISLISLCIIGINVNNVKQHIWNIININLKISEDKIFWWTSLLFDIITSIRNTNYC